MVLGKQVVKHMVEGKEGPQGGTGDGANGAGGLHVYIIRYDLNVLGKLMTLILRMRQLAYAGLGTTSLHTIVYLDSI
jgi:hypothetical protein